MTIYTPEAATAFGALDYDALVDGKSLDANIARTMVRQANRLIRKRHQLLSLQWPMHQSDSEYRVELMPPTESEPVFAPFTMRKKPGITRADVYLRVRAVSGRTVQFSFATRAQPDARQQTLTHTGSGSWEFITRELVLDPGPIEQLTLMARAEGQGALMDESVYGAPNSDTLEDYAMTLSSIQKITGGNPTWDETLIVQDGHYIEFSSNGSFVMAAPIIGSGSGQDHYLEFDGLQGIPAYPDTYGNPVPLFTPSSFGFSPVASENSFTIRQRVWYSLANLLVVGQDRSIP